MIRAIFIGGPRERYIAEIYRIMPVYRFPTTQAWQMNFKKDMGPEFSEIPTDNYKLQCVTENNVAVYEHIKQKEAPDAEV